MVLDSLYKTVSSQPHPVKADNAIQDLHYKDYDLKLSPHEYDS